MRVGLRPAAPQTAMRRHRKATLSAKWATTGWQPLVTDSVGHHSAQAWRQRKSLTPFLPATVFLGPLRLRALVLVR